MLRGVWAAAISIALVASCRGKSGPHDARKDGGANSGAVPGSPARGSGSADAAPSPPTTTPVSPPVVTTACGTVGNAIAAWQRIDQLYGELLPKAKASGWTSDELDKKVMAQYSAEHPLAGASGAPTPSTQMCDCEPIDVDKVCAWYAANNKPPIICEAARKHEAVHVAQCKARGSKWSCENGIATIPLDVKVRLEHEAFAQHLAMLRTYGAANCNMPVPIDACALLDEAGAAEALGRPIEQVERPSLPNHASCLYWGEHSHDDVNSFGKMNMASVSIAVLEMPITLEQFKTKTIPGIEPTYKRPAIPLEGIGDAAISIGSGDKVSGTIMVHKGTRLATIIVWVQRGDGSVDYLEAAKKVGATVASRLPK